jgi:hypothetical protein
LEFYCRNLKDKTDRRGCILCTHYETCKRDGYLDEVDRGLKIPSKMKGTYIGDKELKYILGLLKVSPNEKLKTLVRHAARDYASNKFLWEHRPTFAEIRDLLNKLCMSSEKLTSDLAELVDITRISMGLRIELNRLLQVNGRDLVEVCEGISSLHDATDKLLPQLQRDLPDMPFYLLIRELKEIFEQATGKAATVGRISEINSKSLGTRDASFSPFLKFVSSFLKAVGDSKENLTLETLAKRCQRALDPAYIKPLKKIAGLTALTGIPSSKLGSLK